MKKPKKLTPEQRAISKRITESLLEMPERYRKPLMVFLEQVLDGDEEAVKLSEDYAAKKMLIIDLWEEMERRYASKVSDDLIA